MYQKYYPSLNLIKKDIQQGIYFKINVYKFVFVMLKIFADSQEVAHITGNEWTIQNNLISQRRFVKLKEHKLTNRLKKLGRLKNLDVKKLKAKKIDSARSKNIEGL